MTTGPFGTTLAAYRAECEAREPGFAARVGALMTDAGLDCDRLRAAFALTVPCCVPCHWEATDGNDWEIFEDLHQGELTDGRRFRCCCAVHEALVAKGVVA
jgi:hypothetical protein